MQCYSRCLPLPPLPLASSSSISRSCASARTSASANSNSNSNSNSNANANASPNPNPNPNPNHHHKLSKSAIDRISDKLRHLGYVPQHPSPSPSHSFPSHCSPGHIFIPTPPRLPPFRLASTLHFPTPSSPLPSLAELTLPPPELRRLRTLGIQLRYKLRIGKPGITEGILHTIHQRWKHSELVKIKCHDLSRLNMNHTHHLLETKTGGLVVWRSGSIIVLYRGPHYNFPYFPPPKSPSPSPPPPPHPLIPAVGSPHLVRLQLPGEAKLALEADRLLHGLGPRFLQWPGLDPKPVDADLLPGLVMGFRKPFRILPFGIKHGLTDSEMTTLRRLARPVPPHFALGQSSSPSFPNSTHLPPSQLLNFILLFSFKGETPTYKD